MRSAEEARGAVVVTRVALFGRRMPRQTPFASPTTPLTGQPAPRACSPRLPRPECLSKIRDNPRYVSFRHASKTSPLTSYIYV